MNDMFLIKQPKNIAAQLKIVRKSIDFKFFKDVYQFYLF